jgi:hypothetical protein
MVTKLEFPLYRQNVVKLCKQFGIPHNPIPAGTVKVMVLTFWCDGVPITIAGTDMNRAGRLYFGSLVPEEDRRSYSPGSSVVLDEEMHRDMEGFFADLWNHEPGQGTHKLLDAARRAQLVEVFWETPMSASLAS